MLIKQKPKNTAKYFRISDSAMLDYLMMHGAFPLYSDGNYFYFVQTAEFEQVLLDYEKSLGKEEVNASKAM